MVTSAYLLNEGLEYPPRTPDDKEFDACERCGAEVIIVLIGDESYRKCPDCGIGINQ